MESVFFVFKMAQRVRDRVLGVEGVVIARGQSKMSAEPLYTILRLDGNQQAIQDTRAESELESAE